MTSFKKHLYLIGVCCFLGISGTAMASAIGTASLSNCIGGGVITSATTINWSTPGTEPNTGCFNTGIDTSLAYSGGSVGAGATGNIKDLGAGGGSIDQFMTILGTSPPLDFVLTAFSATPTTSTACDSTVGHSCIIAAGSPFYLTNTATGVSIVLDPLGTITDAGVTDPWSAIFTSQLPNTTDAAIQTLILGGGSISSTYSAALTVSGTATVPEPGSMVLFLAGGIALFGIGRRRREQRRSC